MTQLKKNLLFHDTYIPKNFKFETITNIFLKIIFYLQFRNSFFVWENFSNKIFFFRFLKNFHFLEIFPNFDSSVNPFSVFFYIFSNFCRPSTFTENENNENGRMRIYRSSRESEANLLVQKHNISLMCTFWIYTKMESLNRILTRLG